MHISRRQFIKSIAYTAVTVIIPTTFFWRIFVAAAQTTRKKFARVRRGENLFMAFNNIKDPENGESDEFTSIRNIQNILTELDVPRGTTVIGIGARTGFPDRPYEAPGEMGYLWKVGDAWNAKVTSPVDARPVPLNLDDPIVVTQVGVLHESTAHHFEIDGADLEGSVLWTLYHDDTGRPSLNKGMHNLFSDVDGGLLNEIYVTSQAALKNPNGWATERVRAKLKKFMPNLADEDIWENFSNTLANPMVHSRWLPYIRQHGWQGAAIVLRGSMQNVTQFHLREWVRKSPTEPEFEIGKGTHTSLKIKAGREARPFITRPDGDWTMVGFIWDLENDSSSPSMKTYRDFSDIFGQDFHIHGFRDDHSIGGHTLFSLLGAGKLSVSLYPLSFMRDETAFLFNNDLAIMPKSIAQSSAGITVQIKNSGENFARNVSLRLSRKNFFGAQVDAEDIVVPLINPGQTLRLKFTGAAARSATSHRSLWLDRSGHFLEGGEGVQNNRVDF